MARETYEIKKTFGPRDGPTQEEFGPRDEPTQEEFGPRDGPDQERFWPERRTKRKGLARETG